MGQSNPLALRQRGAVPARLEWLSIRTHSNSGDLVHTSRCEQHLRAAATSSQKSDALHRMLMAHYFKQEDIKFGVTTTPCPIKELG